MKRIVLGLVMAGGLAFLAAPMANAAGLSTCGHSYAFQVHGTEPELSSDSPLHYIVGIGQISFNAAGTSGPTGCTVSHLELEYNDNAVLTLNAGPAACDLAGSLLGGGVPCFDGADHQNVQGTLTPSPFGNGGQRLTIDPSFGWVNTGPGTADLPLAFTLQANTGAAIVQGASVPDNGPTPTSPPPGSPVLVITLQKQSTTVAPNLPINGGGNGYGTAPYLGLSDSLFEGYGSPSANPFNLPGIAGSFGSTVSALQIFPNGQAGGSTSFSSNDNVGNTTGVTENDCDTQLTQESNFADATSNNKAAIVHPSATCGDAAVGAAFTIDTVQFGATDTSDYAIVSGLTDTPDLGGLLVPSGDIATALGLASVPAGKLTDLVVGTTITAINKTANGTIKLTNTSPAGCDVAITMASSSNTVGPNTCALSLVSFPALTAQPIAAIAEGDTPSTQVGQINCTCNGLSPAVSTTSTLKINSSDCPETNLTPAGINTTGITITCKN